MFSFVDTFSNSYGEDGYEKQSYEEDSYEEDPRSCEMRQWLEQATSSHQNLCQIIASTQETIAWKLALFSIV
jgi:hypothetical protein